MRFHALLCSAFLTAAIAQHLAAQKPAAISAQEVDRSVIAALSHQGVTKPKVISHIDLTGPFATVSQWTFAVAQDGGKSSGDWEDQQPIHVCLVKESRPDCSENFYEQSGTKDPWFNMPHHLLAVGTVYAAKNQSGPLLFAQLCSTEGANGNCGIATALYKYDKASDRFVRVFLNLTGRNNNESTRFVESGPLQGDVIVNTPTGNAPYTYWIEVYRANESGQYVRLIRYRGRTHYNDGNRLAVIDSEMPAILGHFGLWKPGDALPVPPHMSTGCTHLYLRPGEEWRR